MIRMLELCYSAWSWWSSRWNDERPSVVIDDDADYR